MDASKLPKYKDMPTVPGMPHGTAWGLFDSVSGTKDQLGTLNLLTPSAVVRAREEIQTGRSVALNWGMDKVHEPSSNRQKLQHKFINWREFCDFYCWDDEVTINTQSGSQWDGLRHWGHSKHGKYYNGFDHDHVTTSSNLGMDAWSERGGLVGRGVLLDYVAYAERHNITYDAMSAHAIPVSDLKAIVAESNIELLPGDLLLVRTGWIKWYEENADAALRREKVTNGNAWVGVLADEECVEWLWDNHFAAVAGDAIGWEVWPPQGDTKLHDVLLSQWGCPIGEMWDLEKLAEECKAQNRWSFFFTSAPLNIPGGVASPPNAIAVF